MVCVCGRDLIDVCVRAWGEGGGEGALAQVLMRRVTVQPRKLGGTCTKQEMNLS